MTKLMDESGAPFLPTPHIVEFDITSPEQVKWFLDRYGEKLGIKAIESDPQEPIVLKADILDIIGGKSLIIEFATSKDRALFIKNDGKAILLDIN